MEIAYLMAGKRLQAQDQLDLNRQLSQYSLISNLDTIEGNGSMTARRRFDTRGTSRYDIVQSFGDSADSDGFDVIVGKIIASNGYGKPDVAESELSELETALQEVREDIPDAKLLTGSYWS